jgi:hypothetical protein
MQILFHVTVEKPPYGEILREIGYFFEILKKYTYLRPSGRDRIFVMDDSATDRSIFP